MKLNNKGFAISTIMYMILIMAVILITLTLTLLSSRKLILDKSKEEARTNIYSVYNVSYREALNVLKSEAIAYASKNSIEKESIKIENLNSSIEKQILDAYQLSEKYLTLSRNNSSYDVYLGKSDIVTSVSQKVENLIDIVDYKIYGNSVQGSVPTSSSPVEIESVGDLVIDESDDNYGKYKIPITISGNNLLDPNSKLSAVPLKFYLGIDLTGMEEPYSLRIELKDNKEVPNGVYFGLVYKNSQDATQASAAWLISNGVLQYNFKTSNDVNTKYGVGLSVYPGTQQNWDKIMDAFEISLYKGEYTEDTMPQYEPYIGTTINIYLDNPLRKIDEYEDYIDFSNNIYIKKINEYIITGKESEISHKWAYSGGYGYEIRSNVLNSVGIPGKTIAMCNYFPYFNTKNVRADHVRLITDLSSYGYIAISDVNYPGKDYVDAFVTNLQNLYNSGNPVKVQYPLKASSSIEIDLPRIPTGLGYDSILSVDTKTKPTNLEFTVIQKIKQL
ncbi:MAG: hypothetical protein IJE04_01395 [Bacilli bacterium]|nr:hypothetical protein [Bacilli bacterium]